MIKARLKDIALEVGFDVIGVCGLEDIEEDICIRYRRWLEDGLNDKMSYLGRNLEKRFSPKKFFEAGKSAIVLVAGYYKETENRSISLYGQTEDYHVVLREKMKLLCDYLESCGGEQKVSVDTSPVMEKSLAARAGVGWIGKNSLIINRINGPWNFLGIIFTSLELERDRSVEDLCGGCRRCIDACPNYCIREDRTLDTRKCISNLTIERKSIEEWEREFLRGKTFGCDICLRVCPYGEVAKSPSMKEFRNLVERKLTR